MRPFLRIDRAGILLLGLTVPAIGAGAQETPTEQAGPNLVVNGDFEAAGQGRNCPFPNWSGRSGQGGQYAFDLAPGQSGKAARITGGKAGRGDIHNAEGFSVKAGEMLRVRFWARTENLKGGCFANLEGEPNENGWHKINIDASADWKLYETRIQVPKGEKGQEAPKILLWFYHFGTGALFLDEISACVVRPDPVAAAREQLGIVKGWLSTGEIAGAAKAACVGVARKVDAALADPKAETVVALRREALAALGAWHGSDGSLALGLATGLDRVFLDEPFRGAFAPSIRIEAACGEAESAQLVVLSAGPALKDLAVELEGDLKSAGGAVLPASHVRIDRVGYVDTTRGKRPYQSPKLGWWPDPLLPNGAFDVKPDECQALWITVTTTERTEPGIYSGRLALKSGGALKAAIPLAAEVYSFVLPERGHFATLALGSGPDVVAKYYGGDPGEKIMERFVVEACKRRLPPASLLNGWAWKTAKAPKTAGGSYDFSKLERWLDLFKANGLTRFPLAVVPRFRKFGGGDYTDEFKREFGEFLKAYAGHLQKKGLLDAAVLYNIDEASNSPKLREWEVCKEIYTLAKQAVPGLRVMQCLNEYQGVKALAGHADIWDLYYGQYEQAGGPERLKAGDEIALAVCVWPSEHPNLFIEYPLLDARILAWIAFRTGAKGFEYWDLFQSWKANEGNADWWKTGDGARTAWKLEKPHGDGLMMYPGPEGTPLSSLRLEALRDGIEDYEYLFMLAERAKNDAPAAALLKEATGVLVTGVTSYDRDPKKLLDLRGRIARVLSKP